jgi:predicted lipid-binding transport protein (Tim44 family)
MLLILLAAAILGGIGSVIIIKENERKRYEAYKRRFEEEMRQEALEREQAQRRQAPARTAEAQPRQRPQAAQPGPKQPAARPGTPPAQPVRRAEKAVRQQPKQFEPVQFDEDQWLHDEEDE